MLCRKALRGFLDILRIAVGVPAHGKLLERGGDHLGIGRAAVSPKLDATEAFLNTVLAMFAADPAPRSDWPAAPHTFEDVVGQAVASLS